jgi:hypothetical protein
MANRSGRRRQIGGKIVPKLSGQEIEPTLLDTRKESERIYPDKAREV